MRGLLSRLTSNQRISRLLTLVMALLIAFAVSLITVTDVLAQRRIYRTKLEEKGLFLARTLNDVVADILYFRNVEGLRNLSNVVKGQPEIEAFKVLDSDGRVLTSGGESKYPVGRVELPDWAALGTTTPAVERSEDALQMLSPVIANHEVIGALLFRFDTRSLAEEVRAIVVQHAIQLLLILGLGTVVAYLLAQTLVRPVKQFVGVTERIAEGDFEVVLEDHGTGEIGDLAVALRRMGRHLRETERKRAEEQHARLRESYEELERSNLRLSSALSELKRAQEILLRQERLRAMGQMASGIAHDINNRLQVILGLSEGLLADPEKLASQEAVRSHINLIAESTYDASAVVGRLRAYYRPQEPEESMTPVDISAIVERAIDLTEPRWRDQALRDGVTVEFETDLDGFPEILANAAELREALINLIFNSLDAMPSGGRLVLRGYVEEEQAVLVLTDDGIGMPELVRHRCLEPFFTTKGEAGSGLGLAMVAGMVQRHNGSLEIESEVGVGTSIYLRFPLTETTSIREAVSRRPKGGGEPLRILLADDDPAVLKMIEGLLSFDGHQVVSVADGREALDRFRPDRFDLVITDRSMPEVTGDEVALTLSRTAPEVPVVLLTGYGDIMNAAQERPEGVAMVLGKPIGIKDLRAALARLEIPPRQQRSAEVYRYQPRDS